MSSQGGKAQFRSYLEDTCKNSMHLAVIIKTTQKISLLLCFSVETIPCIGAELLSSNDVSHFSAVFQSCFTDQSQP